MMRKMMGAGFEMDDLESVSTRGGGTDSDSDFDFDEEAPEVTNAEDSDEEDSSIRTFTNMQNNTSVTQRSRRRIRMARRTVGPRGPVRRVLQL
nr:hypothetical protein CFP56_63150 [Quercus suber]